MSTMRNVIQKHIHTYIWCIYVTICMYFVLMKIWGKNGRKKTHGMRQHDCEIWILIILSFKMRTAWEKKALLFQVRQINWWFNRFYNIMWSKRWDAGIFFCIWGIVILKEFKYIWVMDLKWKKNIFYCCALVKHKN